ncbi:MAG: glutamate racemase [candidate division Zixibacteria bacterium RBG_16_53_22]|nr:MAG: glutamate racemase [candidate division Zixibacteria bacterium RBG_16_53_22]
MRDNSGHRNKAIGIFDSGIGGLTVAREIFRLLPNENVVYFGDTGRYPYGPRSPEIVRKFARQDVNFLIEQGVKFIVVACNTASSLALEYIKRIYNVPMLGVIEPGARGAIEKTASNRIGVIGTHGTISSKAYDKCLRALDGSLKIYSRACPLFVALAEEGYIDRPATRLIAEDYLRDIKRKSIDTLILGCTHYPLLKKPIADIMGRGVRLIDSAEETARATRQALLESALTSPSAGPGKRQFFVSDSPDKFKKVGQLFLGKKIGKVGLVDINSY